MRPRRRSGVLLAGGDSTRFGSPKGLAPFGDGVLLDGPLMALQEVTDETFIVANDPVVHEYFRGMDVYRDVHTFRGGLSALATACVSAHFPTVVVCAWDMPFVTAEVLESLALGVEQGHGCCAPVHRDSTVEPLCAAYDKVAAVRGVTRILTDSDDRSASMLAHVLDLHEWSIGHHLRDVDAERIFFNVNTPADLERATQWLPREPSS